MTRSLLVNTLIAPVLWAFLYHHSYAGSVEFAQWIPWNFVSQELRKNELLLNLTESEVTLSLGEIRPVLSGVSFSTRTMITDFKHEKGVLAIAGSGAMAVELDAFRINQIIEREFGGNVLQIHLKAECARASVEVKAFALHSHFSLNQNGGFLPELKDLALEISSADWKVSDIHCTGLGGIGQEIESALNLAMKDPVVLSVLIRDWMKPHLDNWIKSEWLRVRNSGEDWSHLSVTSPGENGFYLKGELVLQSDEDILITSALPQDPDLQVPRFYLSREGWIAIAKDRMKSLLPKFYDLRQNENFRKLMNSRLTQYLVWPHLRKFHPSTPFVLKTDPSSLDLVMTEVKGQWSANIKGNGSLVTVVGGSPIDYIVFNMRLVSPVSMSLENGSLMIRSGVASANLEWKFGYLYQLLYSPDKKVPIQILSGALAEMAGQKAMVMKLPEFKIGSSEYILGNLKIEDQLLTMDWL